MERSRKPFLVNVNFTVKFLFIILLLITVLFPDLPQLNNKGMGVRAITYPIALLIVPLVWRLRRRPKPYPHLVDALVVMPFLIDVAGNLANLYNTMRWFDDIAHFANWALLTGAFGLALARTSVGRLSRITLTIGFGATTIILWEIAESILSFFGTSKLGLSYSDTIGDLTLSLGGSVLGAFLTYRVKARETSPQSKT